MSTPAVVFAGGGSGGHIYPCLAIAERVRARAPDAEFVFLCSDRAVDAAILRSEHVGRRPAEFHAVEARPFRGGPLGMWRFWRSQGPTERVARQLIRAYKLAGHDVTMIGTGGFVSPAVARAAKRAKVRRALVSLDARPGKANRVAARRVDRVFTAEGSAPKSWERIRPIVRAAAVGASREASRDALGFDRERPVLFVSGGSQGAESINGFVAEMLEREGSRFVGGGWQVVHQTGGDAERARGVLERYRAAGVDAVVRPHFGEVGLCWGAASFAIGRAGAGTVGEAWANGRAGLLLPYPFHRDRNQAHNARALVEAGLVELLEDRVAPAKNVAAHGQRLAAWLDPRGAWSEKEAAASKLGRADGAEVVARFVLGG